MCSIALQSLVALAFLGLCSSASAQEVRANISGIVTDPTSAAVVSANVMVTNRATNLTVTAETNGSGSYATPFLAPGTYQVAVEASGFKKYVRNDVVLQAGDRARLDVLLEVGEVTQSVTVSTAVSQLQTETATRSQVLANEIIQNVPTQGRNPFQIAWAASGVIKSGSWRYLRSFDIGGTSGISINGGREKTINAHGSARRSILRQEKELPPTQDQPTASEHGLVVCAPDLPDTPDAIDVVPQFGSNPRRSLCELQRQQFSCPLFHL